MNRSAGPIGEFHYRLGKRVGGHRPGSHPGLSLGSGQDFAAHARLFDRPDPRRLDLRASLRDPRGDWLVRTYQQRAAIRLTAVVDVSDSMRFGEPADKLSVATELVESMGVSAFRAGDAAALIAFDTRVRNDLHRPARHHRGAAAQMAQALRESRRPVRREASGNPAEAFCDAVRPLQRNSGLVFLISDFHWPLETVRPAIEALSTARLIPVVVWDPAEAVPPPRNGLLSIRDPESGRYRSVWMNDDYRRAWRQAIASRRQQLEQLFKPAGARPVYLSGRFDPEQLSRYFLDGFA